MFNVIDIRNDEFESIKELIYRQSGIRLTGQKKALVTGRLQKSLKKLGFDNFSDYLSYLKETPLEVSNLVNCMSTNHTFFYREERHFDYFSKIALPEITAYLKSIGSNDIRIWCAGCSTGEEAYMLAILLKEFFGEEYSRWNAGILATDISGKVLDFCNEGVYPESKIDKMPASLKNKYFNKLKDEQWKIDENIKQEITFRRFNLIGEVFPFKKPFHIIFCRNVMIYFDSITRKNLINKFHQNLVSGGYFFIGHSETIGREQQQFRFIQPATYKKL